MSSEEDWGAATWEGSRRAQIRRALSLSVRERLEALEALTETSERLMQTSRSPISPAPNKGEPAAARGTPPGP